VHGVQPYRLVLAQRRIGADGALWGGDRPAVMKDEPGG